MNLLIDNLMIEEAFQSLKNEAGINSKIIKRTINNQRTLVIVVDMINGFLVSGALSDSRCNKITGGVLKLLENLNDTDAVFLCDTHTNASAEFKNYPPHCMGDFESEIVEPLKKVKGKVIGKNSTNGYFALSDSVDLSNYSNYIVVGVCTDICVLQLALTLKGYLNEENEFSKNVIVFSELVETFNSPSHNADLYNLMALKLMENAGIQIFNNITE